MNTERVKHDVPIRFYVTERQRELLGAMARHQDMTMPELMRRISRVALEEWAKLPNDTLNQMHKSLRGGS